MLEKLKLTEEKYNDIAEKLMNPDIINDTKAYASYMKEYKNLTPIVEKYREYCKILSDKTDAEEILADKSTDEEMRELAEAEIEEAKPKLEEITEELKVMLLPKDPNDDKNVIIEIRGGAGGEEAALFANSLYRMYTMYAESKHWKIEVLNINETELGGIKEISFNVIGEGAYSRLKYESGVHRVQRVPETESQGRVHTSTVTVAVLVEADEVELEINPTDLKIDVFRASGAGGQHINKTESAVRITHLPTGVVVECQDERSQYKNKDRAMKILRSRLLEQAEQAQNDSIAADRRRQVGSGDRSGRIRTYNFPQNRVSDHRIELTVYRLDAVMNGDLDLLIEPLLAHEQAEKLQNREYPEL